MVYLYWKEVSIMNNSLLELFDKHQGTLIRSDLEKHYISPSSLTRAIKSNEVQKIASGVYVLKDNFPDEYWYRQKKFSKGIYSHKSALILHDLTDLNAEEYTMTFPRSYRNKNLENYYIHPYYVNSEILTLEAEKVKTPKGNEVWVYSKERTLVDIWNPRLKFDASIRLEALKRYMDLPDKKIHHIAMLERKIGKRVELRRAMEVLL